MSSGFYDDTRFCAVCGAYVPYLLSPTRAYCTACLGPVALFSERDRRSFESALRRSGGPRSERAAEVDELAAR